MWIEVQIDQNEKWLVNFDHVLLVMPTEDGAVLEMVGGRRVAVEGRDYKDLRALVSARSIGVSG